MKRIALGLFALILLGAPALAACPATLQLKDNAGVTPNAKYTDDGSGNCMANTAIQDGASATLGAKADSAAGTDTGTASQISLFKRLLQGITTIIARFTDGSQKTQIVDGSGNVVSTTANGLDVNVKNTCNPTCGVINGASKYSHVAASQTAAVLGGGSGAIGDYLSHCVIYPSTTAAGSVTVFDSTNSAANNVIEFTTGTLSNLVPITIPVGAVSVNGAWKATTGANETLVCVGKFT